MTLDELNGIEITGEQFEKLTGYEEFLVKASRHGFIPNRVMSELQVIYDGITGVNTKRNGCCQSSAFVRIMYRWYMKYQAQPFGKRNAQVIPGSVPEKPAEPVEPKAASETKPKATRKPKAAKTSAVTEPEPDGQ
jgi:hypothetical protein